MTEWGIFQNRRDAGRKLSAQLLAFETVDPIVLGLARGGVIVAAEVAERLGARLEAIVVRKIGHPEQREFGLGALTPDGIAQYDDEALERLGMRRDQLESVVREESEEAVRREALYRRGRGPMELRSRTVIAVDDGLATGGSAVAVGRFLRRQGVAESVLASPVCSKEAQRRAEQEFDHVICLECPDPFLAVGQWYEDFREVSDEDVLSALSGAVSSGRWGE